ncbi:biotin--[acetyl-CoA-carboxylase] ligase [Verrucomicrobium spinosum]|uniref:biotin--[acetyl-CoA-carboxylase] ligase n=1 Tax=Verrucomicrobium spinosum TaxID=2736 RepID=UPI0009467779|nr:biotin--[acetyl-CoA-carboxylase] ligase [Verrucomicrobium spinosum]
MSLAPEYTALQPRRLTTALAGHALGTEVQVHETLASTSDHVRDLGSAGYPHGLVVLAEEQTVGRGRRENRWSSPPGQDLLLSVLLRPEVKMDLWPRTTTFAALAICRAIESFHASLQPAIKWPNDVYLNDRKVAGILAETFTGGGSAYMVLGIGLNVNTTTYPPELSQQATSVRLALGSSTPLDRNTIAISLLKHLDHLLSRYDEHYPQVVDEVRQRSWLLGKKLTAMVDGAEVRGVAATLNSEGHLVVQREDGSVMTLTSAEQVRPVAGELRCAASGTLRRVAG